MFRIIRKTEVSKLFVILSALLIIAVAISASSAIVVLRRHEIAAWRKQLDNYSLTLAEQTHQTMTSAYLVLDTIAERVQHEGADDSEQFRQKLGSQAIHQMLRDKVELLPQIDVASVVADNGDVINSSRPVPTPPLNLADRDYYREHLRRSDAKDFVSIPVRDTDTGTWIIYVGRRINDRHGAMLGLVLVGISVDVSSRFYGQLGKNLGPGAALSLYRRDLSLLTRWPLKNELIGKINKSGATYTVIEQLKKDHDVINVETEDNHPVARLGAVRLVRNYPLIVNISVTEEHVLANWRLAAIWIGALASLTMLTLLAGMWVVVRAIRQRELDLQQTIELKQRAEAANLAKSEFLTNMGHEIRTPMNGILGMTQLLCYTEVTDEQRECLECIQTSANNLLAIISDILDYSKIEAGKIRLEEGEFSPQLCLKAVKESERPRITRKNLAVSLEIDENVPQIVIGDQTRLRQILFNLLNNAVKFTAEGSITMAVSPAGRRDGQQLLHFSVTDTGIGMVAEVVTRIFNPFEQADSSNTRKFGGTGLGLTICRRLADLMGGRIWAESTPHKGSTFHLELPFRITAPAPETINPLAEEIL